MQQHTFNQELMSFLDRSPTPYHAVASMIERCVSAGFERLHERDNWSLKPGGRYLVTRNDSSIIAFTLPKLSTAVEQGFRMTGAHTDSPCLKIKSSPDLYDQGFLRLGVEVYGGAILSTWFDRDLSIAGRVSYRSREGNVRHALVDFKKPVAVIPNLAIHLNRDVNNGVAINPQTQLPALLLQQPETLATDERPDFRQLLLAQLQQQGIDDAVQILEHECLLYDTQRSAVIGYQDDFIASARLDNLLSCFIGLQALLQSDADQPMLLVCNDHEEVGSLSASGAQGPFLQAVLRRIAGDEVSYQRMIAHSMLVSCDNAHGIHPNYAGCHDTNHAPILNRGPVIKLNANQRYASNGETSAWFRHACQQANINVQTFIMRSDLACGSTIGPITSAELGVRTLDVGVPQFAMHSVRELAGSRDAFALFNVLRVFNAFDQL